MNKKICFIIILALTLGLAGCAGGEEDYEETTITVSKKGKVSERIVESFGKEYYNLEELKGEFTQSVNEYNESIGDEEINLKDISLKDSKVYVSIDFKGPSDYEKFVGENLFVGSINDAYDEGYTMDVTLKGVDAGDKIGKVQIMGMKDRNIIILSEHVRVRTFRDIAYVSANVDVLDDRTARVLSESDGLAYIILK